MISVYRFPSLAASCDLPILSSSHTGTELYESHLDRVDTLMSLNTEINSQPMDTSPVDIKPPQADSGPVPLSFPALLRNPGLNDRYAHLRVGAKNRSDASGGVTAPSRVKKGRR